MIAAPSCRTLAWALGLALTLPAGARAEGNRLLPFWAQPYPYGYVRTDQPCDSYRRIRTRHGFRTVVVDRCTAVLHARG